VWKPVVKECPLAGGSTQREEYLRQPSLNNYLDSIGENDPHSTKAHHGVDTDLQLHLKTRLNLFAEKTLSPLKPVTIISENLIQLRRSFRATQSSEEPAELEVHLSANKRGSNDGRRS